ncbi:23S rRNA (uridine(2552)-2'-O)-methyltransferase RlmE [Gynuella sunshinyii]|uniref:Ribosomal RNA large subunit methyltransferase E n=1 Tax=Gynuella sunshinyii YC6258 TaxID=1445510 RepID=A0A0C5W3U4_9GAMM|nr:23S rRNA (uridine(2552)-2'-O)-methyltransferase RlmE [Gynuella sunshinyii]AJQ97284.1 23S rRNA methylase [Gynuella sunshinyii YC6258]
MARSKSSGRWLKEHFDDVYVQRSRQDGYRSRASYKLLEINEKGQFIKPGMTVIDLGSAPGGWSQVAAKLVGDHGRVIASDILPMDAIAGVDFIQGDFTEQEVFDQIMELLDAQLADLVISDMAPNMSGMSAVDQPKAMYLVELALDMALQTLRPGGAFIAKVFQGEGFDAYLRSVRDSFRKVSTRKPSSSRSRSREVYLVAEDYNGQSGS